MLDIKSLRKNKKIIEKYSRIIVYIYILTNFLNSKLNMKTGYVVLLFTVINCFLYKEKIKKIKIDIYKMFIFIFFLGIVWNYFGSASDGIGKFIRENSKFIYGMAMVILLNKKNISNYFIIIGLNILSILFLYSDYPWVLDQDYTRIRGILVIGLSFVLIYVLEKIFREKSFLPVIFLIFPILALINSDSRMGAIVVVIVFLIYLVQKFIENRKNLKYILVLLLIFGVSLNYIPDRYISRIKTSFHTKNNVSNEDRIVMWKAAIHIFNENKMFGIGNDSKDSNIKIQDYVDKNVENKVIRREFLSIPRFPRVHNMYLDFLMQNGIMAIVYLVLLFYTIPKNLIFENKNKDITTIAGIYSLLSFYLYGITWSVWSDYGIVHNLFQIILAITISKKMENRE